LSTLQPPPPEHFTARRAIHAIAKEINDGRILSGDQAALRREKLGPAFWRLAVRLLEPSGLLPPESAPWRSRTELQWAAMVAELVRAGKLHTSGYRLGNALAQAQVTEARVLRLASANGDVLISTVRAVAHQLVAAGQRADWADFAMLVLGDGARWGEQERRRLCLDYYRAREGGSRIAKTEEES
jgi:hypothetical protein